MAKFIIVQEHRGEVEYYVSRIPNIQFMEGRENAVEMDQKTVIETMNQLATMQRCSRSREPSTFTMICVKD